MNLLKEEPELLAAMGQTWTQAVQTLNAKEHLTTSESELLEEFLVDALCTCGITDGEVNALGRKLDSEIGRVVRARLKSEEDCKDQEQF